MIREKVTNKGSSNNKGYLLVIIISVTIMILSTIIGLIQKAFDIYNLEYIIFFGLLVFGIFFIRRYITEYRYSFFDDEVIIEKLIGKKIFTMVSIHIWDIIKFVKTKDSKIKAKEDNITLLNCEIEKKDSYIILYYNNCNTNGVVFNPSNEFIQQLNRAINTRHTESINQNEIITK